MVLERNLYYNHKDLKKRQNPTKGIQTQTQTLGYTRNS